MFDLPVKTTADMKAYRDFRKYLITNGFIMMQKSIYTRIALNITHSNTIIGNIKRNRPERGLIQVLRVTEKQYGQMVLISGALDERAINDDSRLIVL